MSPPPLPPTKPGDPVVDVQVVQSAERVLFVRDPATNTSHVWVEVRYTGLAKDFGWVLPLPKVPEVGVGTVRLFDWLDAYLHARYFVLYDGPQENCRNALDGCNAMQNVWDTKSSDAPAAMDGATGSVPTAPGTVDVLSSGSTGPYDYVVIKGSDANALYTWLTGHNYVLPEKAKPILQSHVDAGNVFLAIKLSNGQGINAIRPVTLKMPDAEPCVPLRLTSIAAAEEMNVVVTVAGPGRAVVKNHLDVTVNPFRLKLLEKQGLSTFAVTEASSGDQVPVNYQQVLSAAIDEAGGRAFVTEAAGSIQEMTAFKPLNDWPTYIKPTLEGMKTLFDVAQQWQLFPVDEEFAEAVALPAKLTELDASLPPVQVLARLRACGQFWNKGGQGVCTFSDGKGFDPDVLKATAVDGKAMAAAIQVSIIDPLFLVWDLLDAQPMTTRLAMRISPEEMDRDPVFAFNPALPKVAPQRQIHANYVCLTGWTNQEQATRMSVDGLGSWVFTGNNALDPRFANSPAALAIQLLDETGMALDIAPVQADLVSSAIAGAKPGKPSLPKELVLKTAVPWLPPPSDPLVTKLGPWSQPVNCAPKPGWKDGTLPPVAQSTDAGASDALTDVTAPADTNGTVPGVDAAAGWADAVGGDVALGDGATGNAAKPSAKTATGSSCSAASGPSPAWSGWLLLLGSLLAVLWRRRAA